jgi:hypothetical protein
VKGEGEGRERLITTLHYYPLKKLRRGGVYLTSLTNLQFGEIFPFGAGLGREVRSAKIRLGGLSPKIKGKNLTKPDPDFFMEC